MQSSIKLLVMASLFRIIFLTVKHVHTVHWSMEHWWAKQKHCHGCIDVDPRHYMQGACSSIVLRCALQRPSRGAGVHIYLCWQLHVCFDSSLKLTNHHWDILSLLHEKPCSGFTRTGSNNKHITRRFLVGRFPLCVDEAILRGDSDPTPPKHSKMFHKEQPDDKDCYGNKVLFQNIWKHIYPQTGAWLVCSDCLHTFAH